MAKKSLKIREGSKYTSTKCVNRRLTVELNPWIERVAGIAAEGRLGLVAVQPVAKLLGEKPRTVYAWYRLERVPCFRSALNIVIASKGEVDYNGIFAPFGRQAVAVPGADHGVD